MVNFYPWLLKIGIHSADPTSPELGSLASLMEHPPIYAIDIVAEDGIWTYGPWADRQRILIQDYFFPVHYQHLPVTKLLLNGETRMYKSFDISFKMIGVSSSLKIPFRDLSMVKLVLNICYSRLILTKLQRN